MKIALDKLSLGLNTLAEKIDPNTLDIDTERFGREIEVQLEIDKRESKVAVKLAVRADANLICDRCGDDIQRIVEGDCSVNFVRRNEPFPEEMPGDDLRSFLPGQKMLDVSTELNDALFLALPTRILCSEECKGICFKCGKNLNSDDCTCVD